MIAIVAAYRAGLLSVKYWKENIISGIIVGLIALPLGMAFAIASGVKPEQGIYTSIIAGIIVGLFGGTRVQIAGPTGAFIVILANITAHHGFIGLQIATLMAGIILILMALLKLGDTIKFIPYPVIVGFTSGIGIIILINSIKDFFGLHVQFSIDEPVYLKIMLLIESMRNIQFNTLFLSVSSLLILVYVSRLIQIIPASAIALVYATLMQQYFQFSGVETIGTVYGAIPQTMPGFHFPTLNMNTITSLFGAAFAIALLGAIESLLSARAVDSIINSKHNSNQELIGQGLANIVTPLFGGFAATGAIARTITNVRHGGNSPIAAIIHSITLVAVIYLFSSYAVLIPFAVLAAILFVTAYIMIDHTEIIHIIKNAPKNDVIVLVITFALTVFTNIIAAVSIGVIVSMLFFMSKIYDLTEIKTSDINDHPHLPKNCIVYNIDGPFFFGVAEKIEHTLATIHLDVKHVIFRLKNVPIIDLSGLETFSKIIEQYHKRGVKVYLCEADHKISIKLAKVGITEMVESKIIYNNISDIKI